MLFTRTAEALCDTFRPVMTRMPRGRGALLSLVGGGLNRYWDDPRRAWRCLYDPSIGAWVVVDIRDRMERMYYYCGARDFINPAVIDSILRPGDTYVDVGANIGIHTLRAARRVSSSGHVYAFEANPHTASRLRAHLAMNRLTNVTVFDVALSDRAGKAMLKPAFEGHSGMFTLESHGRANGGYEVPLARGDEILSGVTPTGRVLVKIDVEGHELHVLLGLCGWLAANRPTVIMEFTPAWLQNPEEIMSVFAGLGYRGYRPVARRALGGTCCFGFVPFASPQGAQEDVIWIHESEAPPVEVQYDPGARSSGLRAGDLRVAAAGAGVIAE